MPAPSAYRHEQSRSRAHEGDRMQQDHDKGGHQRGRGKAPSRVGIQKALRGIGYPASKDDVVHCAERSHAGADVIDMLRRIAGRRYDTPASVSKEAGKLM
ncbi:hypothetical protein WS71_11720 [Burkholderia mayonis]|uniref:DUF2795 domain-containing protein n=1 Tax=Burkholderia mayonis TaxID=1385591 RepID=A0A1B4FX42_9BURK|nr:hypothetical protein WS71_11720 [Burkholderia mayonis]KVE55498.1 hypothetical protein WS71_02815 [Burkholderia mayonis]